MSTGPSPTTSNQTSDSQTPPEDPASVAPPPRRWPFQHPAQPPIPEHQLRSERLQFARRQLVLNELPNPVPSYDDPTLPHPDPSRGPPLRLTWDPNQYPWKITIPNAPCYTDSTGNLLTVFLDYPAPEHLNTVNVIIATPDQRNYFLFETNINTGLHNLRQNSSNFTLLIGFPLHFTPQLHLTSEYRAYPVPRHPPNERLGYPTQLPAYRANLGIARVPLEYTLTCPPRAPVRATPNTILSDTTGQDYLTFTTTLRHVKEFLTEDPEAPNYPIYLGLPYSALINGHRDILGRRILIPQPQRLYPFDPP